MCHLSLKHRPHAHADTVQKTRQRRGAQSCLVEGESFTEKFRFNPKEGIINPAMVITDESVETSRPRLCVLKREENESYGFNLRLEKQQQGHIIRNVASGGIAQRSGLQDGDRLLEVNSCYVDDVSHPDVARKMNTSGNQLCLLVLDGKAYEQALSQGQDLRGTARAWSAGCAPPRLCHIRRDPVSGLGITFTAPEGNGAVGEKGRFCVSIVAGGAADKAGVCKGDRLVWMNGATVADLTHSALNRMMKKCGDITILVIDGESEKAYMQKKMPILPAMACPHNLPHRARKLHLVATSNGYGFLLRLEKTVSGRTYHVLRGVDEGGAADKAGMKNGELLLEVNGEPVEALHHEEIVDRVKASVDEVSLTTISPLGLDFYTKLGLSPLLFCQDTAENGRAADRLGPIISEVAAGGSAEKAGLAVGDVLVEASGQNVEEIDMEDVVMLIKEAGELLSAQVMDETSQRGRSDSSSRHVLENEEDELTIL